MFPLSDSAKSKVFPLFNLAIIVANIYVFYLMFGVGDVDSYVMQYALIPDTVSISDPSTWFQFLSSMFLHGGLLHIISNMWFLWVFGDNIEGHYGKILYLIIYFASGIAGGVAQFLLDPSSSIPVIGASGAVSGILGAYFVSHPHAKVRSIVPIFLILTIVNIPAWFYIIYWFGIQVFSGFATIGETGGGVAFWAHVGGFIVGVVLAKLFHMGDQDKGYIEGEIVE